MYDHQLQRQRLAATMLLHREWGELQQTYDELDPPMYPSGWWTYVEHESYFRVVANSRKAPPECLIAIYDRHDGCDHLVKLMLAINPSSPQELLVRMINDTIAKNPDVGDPQLLYWVWENPNFPPAQRIDLAGYPRYSTPQSHDR